MKKPRRMLTYAELQKLPDCKHDPFSFCEESPENLATCLNCTLLSLRNSLIRENLALTALNLQILIKILKELSVI